METIQDVRLTDGYGLQFSHFQQNDLTPSVFKSIYSLICRRDFEQPGFALLDFGSDFSSIALRDCMIRLKQGLSAVHRELSGRHISAVWLGRFDQQVTTKFHLDGGPDASILVLGYEPTTVTSRLRLADYSKVAAQQKLSPQEFLELFNPMFPTGESKLEGEIKTLELVNNRHFQVILINNSRQSLVETPGWQGVLHQATMISPQPGVARIVNSLLLTDSVSADDDVLTEERKYRYVNSEPLTQKA